MNQKSADKRIEQNFRCLQCGDCPVKGGQPEIIQYDKIYHQNRNQQRWYSYFLKTEINFVIQPVADEIPAE